MSEGATIKIDGDASGFIAATEESRKAASGMGPWAEARGRP